MGGAKFGIEAEYALVRPDGRFADYRNTSYADVQPLIETLPDLRHPELRVGDAGIRVKNWYVEGDERVDADGRSLDLAVKGIEIRTPVFAGIAESLAGLRGLRAMLKRDIEAAGWRLATIGFNPVTATYAPDYAPWERAFHASHLGYGAPDVSTLSYGPDLNVSRAGDTPEQAIACARRLTACAPYIVPFSFSAPFTEGRLWECLSVRTFRRDGRRPAVLVHLAGGGDHPLVKAADPAAQHLRIEFKAFDMVGDERLLGALFHLVFGLALADPALLPDGVDRPDDALFRHVAVTGFDDDAIRAESARLLDVAQGALAAAGHAPDLSVLSGMIEARRTPAHRLREAFAATGALYDLC